MGAGSVRNITQLMRLPEERAVRNLVLVRVCTAELVSVPGIQVRVKVEHANGAVHVVQRAEDGEHNGVVAAKRQDTRVLLAVFGEVRRILCVLGLCRAVDQRAVCDLHLVNSECRVIRGDRDVVAVHLNVSRNV